MEEFNKGVIEETKTVPQLKTRMHSVSQNLLSIMI